ncbi:LacI family DNA-binding transcriptional regulator [Lactococcus hircilactis]|uniref:LacI family DNA-binding transcriptional regulator n=2 Tax=Lactococcus hircilactis TaxID=1494462 RepID=A0A7X1Z9K0_9LACT|nr:LacI family DNA-binding transcriptional regulator [Lactococcus hircilactis]
MKKFNELILNSLGCFVIFKGMTTIKEVSKLAGLSPTTVSNVIHGRTTKVSKENIKKVTKILKDTKYVPNMGGRLLARHGSRLIGVVMFYEHRKELNVTKDPFHGELIGALETQIRQMGYFMILYTTKNYEECIKVSESWNIEGLIILGSSPSDTRNILKNTRVPTVFIDTYLEEECEKFYNVGLDDFDGGRQVGDYLFSTGHKKIAFLADSKNPVGVDLERLKGLKKSYEDNGFVFKSEYYFFLSYLEKERHQQLSEIIDNKILKNFDALFFASDFYAVDSMNFLQDREFKIPLDLSVVGFDNNLLSKESRPRLTTVQQDVSKKGELSVKLLKCLISNRLVKEKIITLPAKLIERKSVIKRK